MTRLTTLVLTLAAAIPLVATADEAPRIERPSPTRENAERVPAENETVVRDVLILRGSQYAERLSDRKAFDSAFPRAVAGRRQAEKDSPSSTYGGMVTFTGAAQDSFDLLIEYPNGERITSYPVGQPRSNRELWQNASVLVERGEQSKLRLDADHWVQSVRDAGKLWFALGRRAENALLYDLSLRGSVDLRLQSKDGRWGIGNSSRDAVERVLVAIPDDSGQWRSASLDRLDSSLQQKAKTAETGGGEETNEQASEEQKKQATAAGRALGNFVAAALGRKPAPNAPAKNGNAGKTKKDAPKLDYTPLNLQSAGSAPEIAAAYAESFVHLSDVERSFVASCVRRACEPGQAIVVYEVPANRRDQLVSLEITPRIGPIHRHMLVIAVDLDPRLVETIKGHVADLASDSWRSREEADEELRALGQAALPYLRDAVKSDDAEVIMRAKRIIAAYEARAK